MTLKENHLFVKTSCSICRGGKENAACPYCDHDFSTYIRASNKTIISIIIETFSPEEIKKLYSEIKHKKGDTPKSSG